MTAIMVVAPCHLILPPAVGRACPCPLLLDELEGLKLDLLEVVVPVVVDTAHHSAAG